jgi:hypothetical protein
MSYQELRPTASGIDTISLGKQCQIVCLRGGHAVKTGSETYTVRRTEVVAGRLECWVRQGMQMLVNERGRTKARLKQVTSVWVGSCQKEGEIERSGEGQFDV